MTAGKETRALSGTENRKSSGSRRRKGLNVSLTVFAAAAAILVTTMAAGMPGGALAAETESQTSAQTLSGSGEKVTLRIANWEEYIDEGGWDEEEAIELEDRENTVIFGENSMIEDFEAWYLENYGVEVEVEYSTFGTNEDLYNQMTLGNNFDLVCPSEYMFMKLIAEGRLWSYAATEVFR